ncbi:MscL family protein [Candidatus Falkowbacteria bacterium]|nr:MAG: MscL family protein [Candidatus Falkowbacteria bacterium]
MRKKLHAISDKSITFSQGLMSFLRKYSVIGLAIGVITAQASKDVVDAFVIGVFTPLIKLLVPGDFTNLVFVFHGVSFDIGRILNAGLTFLIIMAFLYFIIKTLLKNDELLDKK